LISACPNLKLCAVLFRKVGTKVIFVSQVAAVAALIVAISVSDAQHSIPIVVAGIATSTAGMITAAITSQSLMSVSTSSKVITRAQVHSKASPKSSGNSNVVSSKRSATSSVAPRNGSETRSLAHNVLFRAVLGCFSSHRDGSGRSQRPVVRDGSSHDRDSNHMEAEMQEFKSMIANSAHDLKTVCHVHLFLFTEIICVNGICLQPLTAFMNGLDTANQVTKDIACRLTECGHVFVGPDLSKCFTILNEDVAAIKSTLNSMLNTNNFMLMSINRAIDFSKASNGISLVPRPESFVVRDLFQYAMSCVRDLNPSSNITFCPVPVTFCNSIITDKQWLLENLLCLVSNAVKFSAPNSPVIVNAQLRRKILSVSSRNGNESLNRHPRASTRLPAGTVLDKTLVLLNDNKLGPHNSLSAKLPGGTAYSVHSNQSSNHGKNPTHSSAEHSMNSGFSEMDTDMFVYVEVEDRGIGILDENAKKALFDGYRQTNRISGGTVSE
jgi:signal transduction histidine kinase